MKSIVRFGVQVCASLMVFLFLVIAAPVSSFSSYSTAEDEAMWASSSLNESTVNDFMDGF